MEILLLLCQKIFTYYHVDSWISIIWILKRSKASLKAEGNSIIFLIRVISISYLKAHFKTTTTMVFHNFKKDFIFDEWIIDENVASKKRDRLSKLKVIYASNKSIHFSIPHPSQDLQLTTFQSDYSLSDTIHHAFILSCCKF